MSDIQFSLKGTSESPAKFVAQARNFSIVIDEPPALGGTDQGANPVEYLLASYAGCLNVVGHLIAGELGFALDKLEIDITGNVNPARLFGHSLEERAGYKNIQVTLKPYTNASPELLAKWVQQVEDRCPINDNIRNITPVEVKVVIG